MPQEALAILLEKMDVVRGTAARASTTARTKPRPLQLLIPAANHILGLDDGKKRFLDTVLAMTKAFSLCGTLDEAQACAKEIAFFSAVKAVIVKATTSTRNVREEEKNSALKQILDNAVVAEGVEDIFAAGRSGQAEYRPAVR